MKVRYLQWDSASSSLKAIENLQSDTWHLEGSLVLMEQLVTFHHLHFIWWVSHLVNSRRNSLGLLCATIICLFLRQVDPDLILNQGCAWIGNPLASDLNTLESTGVCHQALLQQFIILLETFISFNVFYFSSHVYPHNNKGIFYSTK